jgi:hypothetical protein
MQAYAILSTVFHHFRQFFHIPSFYCFLLSVWSEVSQNSWTGLVNIVNYLRSLTCCLRIVADIGQDS